MSKKTQILCYITIIVVALSVTAVLYMLMPACENCGRKFCFGGCTGTRTEDSPAPGILDGIFSPSAQKTTNQPDTRLTETERQGEDYLRKVYFAGDSRTVALTAYGVSSERVFAENGLNHLHALDQEVVSINGGEPVTVPDAVAATAPEILIVNFGINGAAYMSTEEFLEGYEAMIDTLKEKSPDTVFVIESILPVASFYETKADGVTNEKLDELNAGLYQMAKRKGLYYLATSESMKDANNDLISAYTSDGLHYNEAGCKAILDYVLTHAILIRQES